MEDKINKTSILLIIVATLGYFVDVYDLIIFSVVRTKSLLDIGVAQYQLLDVGLSILNYQSAGLILGGILFGILGDKRGRLSVLFGSIALYSLSNILNAYIDSVWQYELLRFIAGIGLAGELGAGITLVNESVSKYKRGIATMFVAGIGVLGALAASIVSTYFDWRIAYLIGGIGGIILLLLRWKVLESGLYKKTENNKNIQRGNLIMLLNNKDRFKRYLTIIFAGCPIFFFVAFVLTSAPEVGKAEGLSSIPTAAMAVIIGYIGLSIGDFASSLYSQLLKSRKKAILHFNILFFIFTLFFIMYSSPTLLFFYFKVFLVGFAVGLWAVINTSASEQFGTNLRATVTTTVPNFIRGLVIPMTLLFTFFKTYFDFRVSLLLLLIIICSISIISSLLLKETFHKDLDYIEE